MQDIQHSKNITQVQVHGVTSQLGFRVSTVWWPYLPAVFFVVVILKDGERSHGGRLR